MPLQATSGAASYDGFGGGAAAVPNYIEDVFSTWLFNGNDTTNVIPNGIDLSTKGGMVWLKDRSNGGALYDPIIYDTARGVRKALATSLTAAQLTAGVDSELYSFNTNGFTLGSNFNYVVNTTGDKHVSWTFRKQPKFFDVVTYTGTGSNTTIAHALGSVPGSIIVKRTDTTAAWAVYHRSLANTEYLVLNTTAAKATGATWWNSTTPTSAVFSVGTDASVNASGGTYVAYLFAHDAGGFGLTGTDNVISCGSFTTDGSGNATVNLGYEPQWVLVKRYDTAQDWYMMDVMRGMNVSGTGKALSPNTADAEITFGNPTPTATGFQWVGGQASAPLIYIAIRRGPMKVPTLGTSVFGLNARTGTGANATVTGGQTDDAVLIKNRGSAVASLFSSRLTGTGYLVTSDTAAEVAAGTTILQANPWDVMDGVKVGTTSTITNASANTYINYLFRRAPGFFDEVCYTGNYAGNPQVPHNLGVAPEMLIARSRVGVYQWYVKHIGMSDTEEVYFNAGALSAGPTWVRTSTYWQYSSAQYPNDAHVAYLFATCPGVSKVGSYTGTATTLQIDCGFTAGARFVLIKRTDSTGDWYVWDSARGIVAGNDPYLLLNSTAAEVTSTDYVDTYSAGFEISSTAPAAINASGGTFIFLAIA